MFRSSELARKTGVSKETLRYYERIGIIPKPSRTNSGYRQYPEESVDRIKFIKKMQDLGFSLGEIDKLLGVVDKDGERCKDMHEFVVEKITEVQQRIIDLRKIEDMLITLKECCPEEKSVHHCPIIKSLMEENV